MWRKPSRPEIRTAPAWRSVFDTREDELVRQLGSLMQPEPPPSLEQIAIKLLLLRDLRSDLMKRTPVEEPKSGQDASLSPTSSPDVETLKIETGGMFLADLHEHLVTEPFREGQEEAESVVPITGLRIGDFRTWDRFLRVSLSSRSKVGAAISAASLAQVLRFLDGCGYVWSGIAHIHCQDGPPRPSSVDLALSRKLEGAGYPAIQAVFSRSGHVRFFSHNKKFEVHVYGSGVQQIEPNLFLVQPHPKAPHP